MNQENKRKIILIDDNAILRTIFGYMLQGFSQYRIEFHSFKNALDALDFLDNNDITESSIPPILFVDINMPFMTGWELMDTLEILSKKPRYILLAPRQAKVTRSNLQIIPL